MTNAASSSSVTKAKKRAKADQEIEKTIITTLMRSIDGRRWLYLQLEAGNLYHNNGNFDLAIMAFEKGERNSALKLLSAIMRWAPDQYVEMLKENKSYVPSSEQETESEDNGRSNDSDD